MGAAGRGTREAMGDVARRWRRVRPGGFALLLAAPAVLGAAHVLVRTSPWGADVSHDPMVYVSVATHLASGEGLRDFDGRDLLTWPPGWPLLLAGVRPLGIDLPEAGRWINAVAFGLTILAAGLWLRRRVRVRWLAPLAAAAVAASPPLTAVSSQIMTEPLFNLATLLALMALGSFLRRGAGWPHLAAASALAALTAVLRYPGVVLIGVGVLLLLLPAGAPRPRAARLRHAAAFGAAASLPLEAALWRNAGVSGTLTGWRPPAAQQPLTDSLDQIADILARWASPSWVPDDAAPLALALVALGCAAAAVRAAAPRSGASGPGPALPLAAFALAYPAVVAVVLPLAITQGVVDRYLTPAYAPLVLLAALLLDRLLTIGAPSSSTGAAKQPPTAVALRIGGAARRLLAAVAPSVVVLRIGGVARRLWAAAALRGRAARRLLAAAALAAAVLHVGAAARASLEDTAGVWSSGYRRDSPNVALRESPTLAWARAAGIADGPTWSNDPRLPWLADRDPNPDRHRWLGGSMDEVIAWLADGEGTAHVVWIDQRRHGYSYGTAAYRGFDVSVLPGVETLAALEDGLVLRAARGRPYDEAAHRARREAAVERARDRIAAEHGEPAARGRFEVYADAAARTLTYARASCAPPDVEARFFLHVAPADAGDLPAHREASGFDNLDFGFLDRGALAPDGSCETSAALPAYAIASIRTGQWTRGEGELWSVEFAPAGWR